YARFSWAGVGAANRTKRPLFLEYNGSEVWVGRYWDRVGRLELLERYERLNLDAAARIFVVSDVERRNLEARGVAAEKIVVNPNGVDVERFRPGVGGVGARSELGIGADEVVAGFVGTFGPWHGVEKLAEAIKLIPAGRFLLVGSGSLQVEVAKRLEAEVASGRVIFTGAAGHERVPGLLVDCETALLVEPGNVEELRRAIVRLIDNGEMRRSLGVKAREVAEKEYTWTHNAQRVLDAYKSLQD